VFGTKNRRSGRDELELLRGLVKLANDLQSSLELHEVVRVIVTAVSDTFGFREATLYLREPGSDVFRALGTVSERPEYDEVVFSRPVPRHIWDQLLLEKYQMGASFYIDHRQHSWTPEQLHYLPSCDLGPRRDDEFHAEDALFLPLLDKRQSLMGVLDLYDPVDRAQPSFELVRALDVFAAHAAMAVENARQWEELEKTSAELQRQLALWHDLHDLSTVLLSTLDQESVLPQVTALLKGIVDYDAMDIRLVDEERGELVPVYARDENAEEILDFASPLDLGVTGWVVRHNEAQLVNDMTKDPRGVVVPGTEIEPQASIVVPLNVRGKVTGVLTIDRLRGRVFEEHELESVRLFANLAAVAIQNALSYDAMERQAISDGLTGIYNYRHFQDALSSAISRAERYGETFCLLMMDLDHFKAVNDTIGHQRGDDVLRDVAGALKRCSRESDYLARYGGEEFVMILPRTSLPEAQMVAERVRTEVAAVDAGALDLRVTVSVGVASYPESARDTDGVLGAADAALLRAKARGRNRVCLFTEDKAAALGTLEGDLVVLGREFAEQLGLSESETAGLLTALAVYESGGRVSDEVQTILGEATAEESPAADEVRQNAFDALLYGSERWDGGGYPEGRRGVAIPRVARAFAVCRGFHEGNGNGVERLRAEASHEFDPRMVQRFSSMVRATEGQLYRLSG
jgi:diguanylate cyclase (GGDEF)-like protein